MSVKRIFLSVICLSCFLSAHAGQGADSVRIYYRAGYRYVESDYRDNGMQLSRFTESVRRALRDGTIERIVVRSGASPDGATAPTNCCPSAVQTLWFPISSVIPTFPPP